MHYTKVVKRIPLFLSVFLLLLLSSQFFVKETYASILFQDNFESGNDNQWTKITGQSIWTVQNGMYGGIVNTPSTIIDTVTGNENWANYIFEFDIKPVQGEDKNIRIL